MTRAKPLFVLASLTLTATLLGCGADAETAAGSEEQDIAAGSLDPYHPYVGLVFADGFVCSGTLLGPHRVVTAAHCVGKAVDTQFLATKLDAALPKQSASARRVSKHPRYAGDVGGNDIAVVYLHEAIGGPYAELGDVPDDLKPGDCNLMASGFGIHTPEGFTTAGQPRKRAQQCVLRVEDDTVVTKGKTGGTCEGDSGGPLLIKNTDTMIGVLSGGPPGCKKTNESIYVLIERQRDFIQCAAIEDAKQRSTCMAKL